MTRTHLWRCGERLPDCDRDRFELAGLVRGAGGRRVGDPSPPSASLSYSVPPLEMRELAHERGGHVGIELAVQEDGSLRIAELRGYPREVIERADGLGLEAEAGGDRRKVDVWEHRFRHRLLAEFQEMQLGPVGAVVQDDDDERQVLAYYRL